MGVTTLFGQTFAKLFDNHLAWLGGLLLGVITYLVEPGAAFYALWIVVACDLVSRLITEARNHDGIIRAIKNGHISSDKAIRGTGVKIAAYFIMCVIAAQSKHLIPYEFAAGLVANIVYSILFFVEVLSIAENFLEAGVEEFSWLARFSKRKLEKICEDENTSGMKTEKGGVTANERPPI